MPDESPQPEAGEGTGNVTVPLKRKNPTIRWILIFTVILLLFVNVAAAAVGLSAIPGLELREIAPGGATGNISGGGNLQYPATADSIETPNCVERYLRSKSGAMIGFGNIFVTSGKQYNVSPALMIAIGAQESSLGKAGVAIHGANFNYYGMTAHSGEPSYYNGNAYFRVFASWEESITNHARYIREKYFDANPPLTTIPAIHTKYAPVGAPNDPTNLNSQWVRGVTSAFNEIIRTCPQLAPETISTETTGKKIAVKAVNELNYKPDREDCAKYNPEGVCQDWCSNFVNWAYKEVGLETGAGATAISQKTYFEANQLWYPQAALRTGTSVNLSMLKPGDVFVRGDGKHTGIIEEVKDGKVYTIEGNTPGDLVKREEYTPTQVATFMGVGRWKY